VQNSRSYEILNDVCCPERKINQETLREVLLLALEIAREGREGKKIGTLFVVSDSGEVLKRSRPLILDPLYGHPNHLKHITSPDLRETVKELALLDGAFVVDDDGVVISACRYINAPAEGIRLPLGFGTRHMAAASISKVTDAVGVVVSESSIVRVFDDGELISEIIPEIWMLSKYSHHLTGLVSEKRDHDLTVISKASTSQAASANH